MPETDTRRIDPPVAAPAPLWTQVGGWIVLLLAGWKVLDLAGWLLSLFHIRIVVGAP